MSQMNLVGAQMLEVFKVDIRSILYSLTKLPVQVFLAHPAYLAYFSDHRLLK